MPTSAPTTIGRLTPRTPGSGCSRGSRSTAWRDRVAAVRGSLAARSTSPLFLTAFGFGRRDLRAPRFAIGARNYVCGILGLRQAVSARLLHRAPDLQARLSHHIPDRIGIGDRLLGADGAVVRRVWAGGRLLVDVVSSATRVAGGAAGGERGRPDSRRHQVAS